MQSRRSGNRNVSEDLGEFIIERTSLHRMRCQYVWRPPTVRKIAGDLRDALNSTSCRRWELICDKEKVTKIVRLHTYRVHRRMSRRIS